MKIEKLLIVDDEFELCVRCIHMPPPFNEGLNIAKSSFVCLFYQSGEFFVIVTETHAGHDQ